MSRAVVGVCWAAGLIEPFSSKDAAGLLLPAPVVSSFCVTPLRNVPGVASVVSSPSVRWDSSTGGWTGSVCPTSVGGTLSLPDSAPGLTRMSRAVVGVCRAEGLTRPCSSKGAAGFALPAPEFSFFAATPSRNVPGAGSVVSSPSVRWDSSTGGCTGDIGPLSVGGALSLPDATPGPTRISRAVVGVCRAVGLISPVSSKGAVGRRVPASLLSSFCRSPPRRASGVVSAAPFSSIR